MKAINSVLMCASVSVLFLVNAEFSFARSKVHQKIPSSSVLKKVIAHNNRLAREGITVPGDQLGDVLDIPLRPYAEHEKAAYLVLTYADEFDSLHVRQAIAQNLPSDITLVVLADSSDEKAARKFFGKWVPSSRLWVIPVNHSRTAFWARDALPIAVWNRHDQNYSLVEAQYYYHFKENQTLSDVLKRTLKHHSYYYEGGNFQADSRGNCFLVNHGTGSSLPDEILKMNYGCQTINRFPFSAGIGHVDERVRIISDAIAVTDTPEYEGILKKYFQNVVVISRPARNLETYSNSLLINETVFLPVFNEQGDSAAIQSYQKLGLNVIPIETKSLSNNGKGSIHCITMAYPRGAAITNWLFDLVMATPLVLPPTDIEEEGSFLTHERALTNILPGNGVQEK